jgi:solute carrier family 25 uncoupling protein 8/9
LYEPVKQLYVGKDHTGPISVWIKILAALTTGAIGISIANPTDVAKIRFQGEGKKPEHERRYLTVRDAYRKIIR